MVDFLGFSETVGASLYHGFAALCYFTPVIGAIIADSFLGNTFSRSVEPYFFVWKLKLFMISGKFRTIFYISIIYAIGQIVLTIGAVDLGSSGLNM